jgi:NAD-dependent deacetylase
MERLIVFTGAGMSAESGIPTFRGTDGLWENHRVEDVATPEAWDSDPELVTEFYNQRRKRVLEAAPNAGHAQIARWQEHYDVMVVTQNIDDLHERAGSKQVLHLHGEIRKARSTSHPHLVYDIEGWQLTKTDVCEQGSRLRPHIVWFGEDVPMLDVAARMIEEADLFIVVGTSLQVYPAAALVHHAWNARKKIIVDPQAHELAVNGEWTVVAKGAGEGLAEVDKLFLR